MSEKIDPDEAIAAINAVFHLGQKHEEMTLIRISDDHYIGVLKNAKENVIVLAEALDRELEGVKEDGKEESA